MKKIGITNLKEFHIGNAQNKEAGTGCTVIICEEGAVAGVDIRGGSPGTRETDALSSDNLRQSIHAVMLAGGSAFGLDAAGGAMKFLEERGIGREVAVTKVPIVCGAILFDLKCGDYRIRPDQQMGYEACKNAYLENPREGNFGAGTGATIGKAKGEVFAMKGGLGMACFQAGELQVGAIMAVNCVGDIYDPSVNRLIAGTLSKDKKSLADSEKLILGSYENKVDFFSGNTIIGAVITNAVLTKPQANKLASVSHNGIARVVRPAHTIFDGDAIFTMASGKVEANIDAVAILAVRAVEQAIINAVKKADTAYGFLTYQDLLGEIPLIVHS
jgi:L-aminopeptidase/D-esterase-like protein